MEFVKRPMLVGAGLSIIASVAAFYFRSFIPLFAVMATAVILIMVVFLKADKRLLGVWIIILLVLFGSVRFYRKTETVERISGQVSNVELTFCEDEQKRGKGYSSVVKVDCDGAPLDGSRLSLYSYNTGGYRQGDRIVAVITVEPVDSKYRAGSYCDGVIGQCKIKSVEDKLSPDRFGADVGDIRRYVKDTLFSNLTPDCAATILALVTGDRSYLSDELYNAVKNSGVSHVMVVSGLHLSIIMSAVYSLISVFGKNRFAKAVVSVLAVLFISAVCGFTMSIMRAGLMFIVAALAPILGRDNDTVNSLGTAVVLIILHTPFAIFSVALQLSVLSTYGILVLAPEVTGLFERKMYVKNKIVLAVFKMFAVTLSASFMTFPVAVYYFGYISATAPITNILITHAVSVALVSTVIGLFLSLVPAFTVVSDLIFIVCELLARYINYIIALLGRDDAVIIVGRWAVLPSVFLIGVALQIINYCKKRDYLLKLKK